jgi:hypothetical protein
MWRLTVLSLSLELVFLAQTKKGMADRVKYSKTFYGRNLQMFALS